MSRYLNGSYSDIENNFYFWKFIAPVILKIISIDVNAERPGDSEKCHFEHVKLKITVPQPNNIWMADNEKFHHSLWHSTCQKTREFPKLTRR